MGWHKRGWHKNLKKNGGWHKKGGIKKKPMLQRREFSTSMLLEMMMLDNGHTKGINQ